MHRDRDGSVGQTAYLSDVLLPRRLVRQERSVARVARASRRHRQGAQGPIGRHGRGGRLRRLSAGERKRTSLISP